MNPQRTEITFTLDRGAYCLKEWYPLRDSSRLWARAGRGRRPHCGLRSHPPFESLRECRKTKKTPDGVFFVLVPPQGLEPWTP